MKNHKKIIWAIVIIVAIIFGTKYIKSLNNPSYEKGAMAMAVTGGWSNIIANEVNKSEIFLTVDGKPVAVAQKDLIMSNSEQLLINTSVLKDIFSCVVNVVNGTDFYIEKGNTQVVMNLNATGVTVNNAYKYTDEKIYVEDDNYYIPVSVLQNYFSYEFEWNYKQTTAFMTNKKQDEKIYPFAYDYRKIGRIIRVNDQAELGTCWAFASLTAIETTFMPEEVYDFSEDHMSLNNSFNLNQMEGGKYNMAMAYLASWTGPVYEEEDPYGDGYSPEGLTSAFHVQEIQIIPSKDLEGIKKAVFLYGGVQSSLYMPLGYTYESSSEYYDAEHCAYYHVGNEKANHDVVIVGWDDSYPAANFSTQPEGDGAFICVNSWGEEFGEEGFFYVSYYDSGIGVYNMVYTKIENNDNYDNIYQSDLCGWVGQLGYNREYGYFANVYTAKQNEMLEAVGFYATTPGTEYEVYIVEDFVDEQSMSGRQKVAEGSFVNAGYYTVELDKTVYLPEQSRYAIVVYINSPSSEGPIAIECITDGFASTVDISDGEGYISLHGTYWEHIEETQNCNVCLKAYTSNIEEQKGN